MDSRQRAALKAEANRLQVRIHLGKSGLTDGVIAEVKAQAKRTKLVKVKLHARPTDCIDRQALARELAGRTGLELVEVKGNTIVLAKLKKTKQVG